MSSAILRWRAFAQEAPAGVHLMESHLLQGPIGSLLMHGLQDDAILQFVGGLMQALEGLCPRLALFRVPSPEGALKRILAFRWGDVDENPIIRRFDQSAYATSREIRGFSGYLSFIQHFVRLAEAAVALCSWPALVLDTEMSDPPDYQRRLGLIRDFLGVPGAEPEFTGGLERFQGRYAWNERQEILFEIKLEGDHLLVVGCPILWRAGNPLIQIGQLRFSAASWPIDVIFSVDGNGKVVSARLVDPGLAASLVSGVHCRLMG